MDAVCAEVWLVYRMKLNELYSFRPNEPRFGISGWSDIASHNSKFYGSSWKSSCERRAAN